MSVDAETTEQLRQSVIYRRKRVNTIHIMVKRNTITPISRDDDGTDMPRKL